jgi:hypothetical protein
MPHNLWRGVLIAVLSAALVTPSRAETLDAARDQVVIGIVVVSAAVAVLVTVLILHQKHKKSTMTGCVRSGANGLSLTDEKDQRIYALSGDPVGVKAGDRMTFQGKRRKDNNTLEFAAESVTKDFGACTP